MYSPMSTDCAAPLHLPMIALLLCSLPLDAAAASNASNAFNTGCPVSVVRPIPFALQRVPVLTVHEEIETCHHRRRSDHPVCAELFAQLDRGRLGGQLSVPEGAEWTVDVCLDLSASVCAKGSFDVKAEACVHTE